MEKITLLGKIALGNLLMACAVNAFILPFSFISGGSTGLALVLHHLLNLPFQSAVTGISVICFLLGWLCLGSRFALTTLFSTILYPLCVTMTGFLSRMQLVSDALVAAVLGGLLMGLGLGIIIQSGASSGGMDIPPLVLQKYCHIPVTAGMWGMDLLLLLAQVTYSGAFEIFCGVILSCVTMLSMNRVLMLGKSSVQILVISRNYEAIRKALIQDQDKGVSLFTMESGYEGMEGKAVCSVFPQKDLAGIRAAIYAIDPSAFMIVSNVQEVRGYRFTGWEKKSLSQLFL